MSLVVDSSHQWFFCQSLDVDSTKKQIEIDPMQNNTFKFFIPSDGLSKGIEIVFNYDPAEKQLKGTYTFKKCDLSDRIVANILDNGKRLEVFPSGFCNRERWLFERDDAVSAPPPSPSKDASAAACRLM